MTYLHDKASAQIQLLTNDVSNTQLEDELSESQMDAHHLLTHPDESIQSHLIERYNQVKGVSQDYDQWESQLAIGMSKGVLQIAYTELQEALNIHLL